MSSRRQQDVFGGKSSLSGMAFFYLVLLAACVTYIAAQEGEEKNLWVSMMGEDTKRCGAKIHPCRTLPFVINKVEAHLNSIVIDTTSEPYQICANTTLNLKNSIELITSGDYGVTGCSIIRQLVNITLKATTERTISLSFRSSSFANITIIATNLNLQTQDCRFNNVSFYVHNDKKPYSVQLLHSTFEGEIHCLEKEHCRVHNHIFLMGIFDRIVAENFNLYQTKFNMERLVAAFVAFTHCLIANDVNKPSVDGGIRMKNIQALDKRLDIKISNCTFTRQRHSDAIDSTTQLGMASLYLRPDQKRSVATQSYIDIRDCNFTGNERGLFIAGYPSFVTITRCRFYKNQALQPAAALYIIPRNTENATISISNSSFIGNSAGVYRSENYQIPSRNRRFTVDNGEVVMYSNCCKGALDLQGKGGAIRIQGGKVNIVDCFFKDNIALRLGGSIFVDYGATVTIARTTFYTTENVEQVTHGDVIHSNGTLELDGAVIYARAALDYAAIFQHNGHRWSLRVYDIKVTCPAGYIVRSSNATSYKIAENVGLMTSIILDQLSYYCEACPRLKYDLVSGFLHYTASTNALAYLTLRIDGISPNLAAGGQVEIRQPQCLTCPYGGVCEKGIRPQDSFWGYEDNEKVKFVECPKGYCCEASQCLHYSSCATHREGDICGKCREGYTEALYSAECVPDLHCSWTWLFIPVVAPVIYAIIVYALVSSLYSLEQNSIEEKAAWVDTDRPRDKTTWSETDRQQFKNCEGPSRNSSTMVDPRGCQAEPSILTFFPTILTAIWYIQDIKFFRTTETVFDINSLIMHVYEILAAASSFRLSQLSLLRGKCVFTHLVAWQKQVLNLAMVPCIFVIYTTVVITLDLCKCKNRLRKYAHTVSQKINSGYIVILHIIYQTLLLSSFKLIHCFKLGKRNVLYISGNEECFQPWQIAVLVYLGLCLAPLPICLFFGPAIRYPSTSNPFKLAACLCFPGPVLMLSTISGLRQQCWSTKIRRKSRNESASSTAASLLYGAYKDNTLPRIGPVSWIGFHYAYRFALVALSVYLTNHLLRVLCMGIACFIFLLFHSHLRPYHRDFDNNISTGAYSLLMATGVVNCVKATFTSANRKPVGPNAVLLLALHHIENCLCVWLPATFFIVGICYYLFKTCRKEETRTDANGHTPTYDYDNHDIQMKVLKDGRASSIEDSD